MPVMDGIQAMEKFVLCLFAVPIIAVMAYAFIQSSRLFRQDATLSYRNLIPWKN